MRFLGALGKKAKEFFTGRKKARPLALERGQEASMKRNSGILVLRKMKKGFLRAAFGGRVMELPLIRTENLFGETGVLQGVFELKSGDILPEIATFYFYPHDTHLSMRVFNEKGELIGEFSPDLKHRKVAKRYRRLGIATHAFDLLEEHSDGNASAENPVLKTTDLSVDKFLRARGYKETGREPMTYPLVSTGGIDFSEKMDHRSFLSRTKKVGWKEWHDLSKFHRVKIVGVDGKIKYWTGRTEKGKSR